MNPTIIALGNRAYRTLKRRCNRMKYNGRKLSPTSYDEFFSSKSPSQFSSGTVERIKEFGVLVPVAEAVG